MTEEDELFQFDGDYAEQIKKLKELFTDVPVENLVDVYDKCDKDFLWTVELLSISPMVVCPPTTNATESKVFLLRICLYFYTF